MLPNGDVLVAETNSPPKDEPGGIRGWFVKRLFRKAGAAVPRANRVTLLRDGDGDGVAEVRSMFLRDQYSPFGMALAPDHALGPHNGSLGLAWSGVNALPAQFATGIFVGQHGSWNRVPFSGYQVIVVPFSGSRPTGALPVAVLTGFPDREGRARGRPVGVALDSRGALLVADDVGNVVWRVSGGGRP